jgi:hypothetical protein
MSTSSPLVTKKRIGLGLGLGLGAIGVCAASCAAPLFAALGIGGALAGAAGCFRPGPELFFGLIGAGALGFFVAWIQRRQCARSSKSASATAGSCGCGPAPSDTIFTTPTPGSDEPIVCTADLDDRPTVQGQLDGYRAAFRHLLRVERFSGGIRWVFADRAGLAEELRALAAKEHTCCKFFKFDLRRTNDSIVWETTADEQAAAMLEEFARLPDRLRQHPQGNDADAIKQSASAAGLVFAGDTRGSK